MRTEKRRLKGRGIVVEVFLDPAKPEREFEGKKYPATEDKYMVRCVCGDVLDKDGLYQSFLVDFSFNTLDEQQKFNFGDEVDVLFDINVYARRNEAIELFKTGRTFKISKKES